MNPFDLQTVLDNMMTAKRHKAMVTSPQLTLGELIARIEGLGSAALALPVQLDFRCQLGGPARPESVSSWRGAYDELAIEYGIDDVSGQQFLDMLTEAIGKTYTGYKGGEYVMGKVTPVWVANYGNCDPEEFNSSAGVVGVSVLDGVLLVHVTEIEY